MILYSLRCSNDHHFEAWFRDGATYDAQAAAGGVTCPLCGDNEVGKAPMAPRIGRQRESEERRAVKAREAAREAERALEKVREHVESTCDYVGDQFAEEARRIHYREVEARAIYGEASDTEVSALRDEGVEFERVPWLPRRDS